MPDPFSHEILQYKVTHIPKNQALKSTTNLFQMRYFSLVVLLLNILGALGVNAVIGEYVSVGGAEPFVVDEAYILSLMEHDPEFNDTSV